MGNFFYKGISLPPDTSNLKKGIYFIVPGDGTGSIYGVFEDGTPPVLAAEINSSSSEELDNLQNEINNLRIELGDTKTTVAGALESIVNIINRHDEDFAKINEDIVKINEYIGDLPEDFTGTSVIDYINERTEDIASNSEFIELSNRVGQNEMGITDINTRISDTIDNIEKNYYKNETAAELEGSVGNIDVRLLKVEADVNHFFEDALEEGKVDELKDTLKEIQQYIDDNASGVTRVVSTLNEHDERVTALEVEVGLVTADVDEKYSRIDENTDSINSIMNMLTWQHYTGTNA